MFRRCWKNAFAILIYNKKSNTEPSNFCPITLQLVLAKIYSSLIRNRIYDFLIKNDFIETRIQKGFWKGISSTIEHIELLSHIINQARNKQRQVIVTLLDLKNAFGAVDHRWIMLKVLEYHHLPAEIKTLIIDYYDNHAISVGMDDYSTEPIIVGKGVLQGDCLTPLLFKMIVNTLVKSIDHERKIRCMGYSSAETFLPCHLFQFADDSAITTSTEKDKQLLLNIFNKWCNLAGLIIYVDKCLTFGIKKNGNSSTRFKPYLKVNNEVIPPVKLNDNFTYLGKKFSYTMSVDKVKSDLISDFNSYIDAINRLPLHPKNKLDIITRYVYSKVRWHFSI